MNLFPWRAVDGWNTSVGHVVASGCVEKDKIDDIHVLLFTVGLPPAEEKKFCFTRQKRANGSAGVTKKPSWSEKPAVMAILGGIKYSSRPDCKLNKAFRDGFLHGCTLKVALGATPSPLRLGWCQLLSSSPAFIFLLQVQLKNP